MVKAMIEVQDAWEAIEPPVPIATASVEEVPTGDGIAAQSKEEPKKELKEEPKSVPVDKIKDAKARTVIMGIVAKRLAHESYT
jgi:hypothetical protein